MRKKFLVGMVIALAVISIGYRGAANLLKMRAMVKKAMLVGVTILLIVLGLGGLCGWGGARMLRSIFNIQYSIFNWEPKLFKWCFRGLPLVDKIDKLLEDKTYIVLLQK